MAVVLIVLLMVSACQEAVSPTPTPSATPPPPTATPTQTPTPTPTPSPPPVGTATPAGLLVPTPDPLDGRRQTFHIQIPQIGVDTQLIPVGLDTGGAMASPEDPYKVGWYWPGAMPGSQGNLLVSGHLDWMDWTAGVPRTGIFWRLRELAPGSHLLISDGSTQWTYVVRSTLKYRYDDPAAVSLLQPTNDARATIITCEGPGFDPVRRNYTYRRILLADLVEATSLR